MKPTVAIPGSHRDLLTGSLWAALATTDSDGFPRVAPVGCDLDDAHVLVRLASESAEARNVAAGSPATILAIDPDDGGRWIEVRGDTTITVEDVGGTAEHSGADAVICRIRPIRVNLDAIHR